MNSAGKTLSPCGAITQCLEATVGGGGLRHRWYQSAALSPHGHIGMLPMQTCKRRQMNVLHVLPGMHPCIHGHLTTHVFL